MDHKELGEGGFLPKLVAKAAMSLSWDSHPSLSSAFPAQGTPEVADGRC